MTRLFLILLTVIQLSGCAVVLETAAGTFVGTIAADAATSHFKGIKDGNEKEPIHKSQDQEIVE